MSRDRRQQMEYWPDLLVRGEIILSAADCFQGQLGSNLNKYLYCISQNISTNTRNHKN